MSKTIELQPGEQLFYRTASSLGTRIMAHYFLGFVLLPLFGIGIMFLFGWGLAYYSDVAITSRRVMLKKSGLFRNRRGHRSIPLDQIYLYGEDGQSVTQGTAQGFGNVATVTAVTRTVKWVELDLQDGKTVKIAIPRTNVFLARLQDAMNAEPSAP